MPYLNIQLDLTCPYIFLLKVKYTFPNNNSCFYYYYGFFKLETDTPTWSEVWNDLCPTLLSTTTSVTSATTNVAFRSTSTSTKTTTTRRRGSESSSRKAFNWFRFFCFSFQKWHVRLLFEVSPLKKTNIRYKIAEKKISFHL